MYSFPRVFLLVATPPPLPRWLASVPPRHTAPIADAFGPASAQGQGEGKRSAVRVMLVVVIMILMMTQDLHHSPVRNMT